MGEIRIGSEFVWVILFFAALYLAAFTGLFDSFLLGLTRFTSGVFHGLDFLILVFIVLFAFYFLRGWDKK
jgi:hypothetical protein